MNNWLNRAFITSMLPNHRAAEFEANGRNKLTVQTDSMYREYINRFEVYVDGTLISVTNHDEDVNFFIVYPDIETLKFIKDIVIVDIYSHLSEYLTLGSINELYIPDIVNQVIPVSNYAPNTNVSYTYPGLDFDQKDEYQRDYYGHQKITHKYTVSVRFDKLVCTFSQPLYLYKLVNNDPAKTKSEIRTFIRPIVNLLSFINENPMNIEAALDLIANINFITHSSIFPVLRTAKAINSFIKFCKAFPCEKTFEIACQEIVMYDNFFKRVLDIKRTRNYIKDNGKNLIYSKHGINVTPTSRVPEFRIWNQRMEPTLNSIRSLGVILVMFGEFDQFKADVERTLLRNA